MIKLVHVLLSMINGNVIKKNSFEAAGTVPTASQGYDEKALDMLQKYTDLCTTGFFLIPCMSILFLLN